MEISSSDIYGQEIETPPQTEIARRAQILVLYITLLAGNFTLARLTPELEVLGLVGQIAFWLLSILVLFMLASQVIYRYDLHATNHPALNAWLSLVILLHLYLCMSILWAPSPQDSLEVAIPLFIVIIVLATLPWVFAQSTVSTIEFCLSIVLWVAIAYSLGGFYNVLLNSGPLERMSAFGGGSNVFIRIVSSGIFVSLYFGLKKNQFRWLLTLPLLAGSVILSGSRGGLVALISSGFICWVYLLQPKLTLSKGLKMGQALMLMIGFLWILFSLNHRLWDFVWQRYMELTLIQGYTSNRDVIFLEAWTLFLENPLLGVGVDGFRQLSFFTHAYPHNLILQVAAEGGMVGLLILCLAFLILLRQLFRPKSLEHRILFVLGTYYFIASMFSGGIYDTRFLWFFWSLYMLPFSSGQPENA